MSIKDNEEPAYITVNDMVSNLNNIINNLQGYEDGCNHNPVGLTAIEEEIKFEYGYVSKRLQDFLNESMNLITYCYPNYKKPNYTLVGLKECLIEVSRILKHLEDGDTFTVNKEDRNG